MKKLFLILIASLVALSSWAETYSGSCGDNLTWSLNTADSTLTFSGSGAMVSYSNVNRAPWYRYRNEITNIVLPSGITEIGAYAFAGAKISQISIPNTVTAIKEWSFTDVTTLTTITIPASVTSISSTAFTSCTGLTTINVSASNTAYSSSGGVLFDKNKTSIIVYPACKSGSTYTIPSSVTRIKTYAFRQSQIQTITIPKTVTAIEAGAFIACYSLTSISVASDNPTYSAASGVLFNKAKTTLHTYPIGNTRTSYTIPSTVQTIGDMAFPHCRNLKSITIPSSVTKIGGNSMACIENFDYINIPASVTTLGTNVFHNSHIKGYRVAASNPNFSSRDGVLYNKAKTTLINYPIDSVSTAFTIPSTVTSIAQYAFADSKLVEVYIPNSITSLEIRSFHNCASLLSINIPSSVTSLGSAAFSGCSSLLDIIMNTPTPPAVGTDVFYDSYDKALAVPCGAKAAYRADAIFGQFDNIIEQCYYDVNVTSSNPEHGTVTGGGTNLLGGSVIQLTATPVQDYDFIGWSDGSMDNPRNYLVEGDATVVANFAHSCTFTGSCGENLTYVIDTCTGTLTISGTGDMNLYSYSNRPYITTAPWGTYADQIFSLTIEEGVTSIGNYAFYNCSNIQGNLVIPNSVIHIGEGSFGLCSGFNGSLGLSDNIEIIGSQAFDGCSGLNGPLNLPEGVRTIGFRAFAGCHGFSGSLSIPNSVTSLEDNAFSGCSGFTGLLTIPNGITTIKNATFSGCQGLTRVIIPNNITKIELLAFSGCTGLSGELTIPENVTSIGQNAFKYCENISSIRVESAIPPTLHDLAFEFFPLDIPVYVPCEAIRTYKRANVWKFFTNIQGEILYSGTCGDNLTWTLSCAGTLTISGTGAMTNYSGSTSGTTTAPWGAYAQQITSLVIEEGVTSIGQSAFLSCSGLTGSLTIPNSVTTIGRSAFYGCSGFIGPLVIPDGIVSIGSHAFSNCSGFNGILTISNTVASIGECAFDGCSGFIGPLSIPQNLRSIAPSVFHGCSGFTGSLIIPDGVVSIGSSAFDGCSGFTGELNIPNSVTSIGATAFADCSGFIGTLTIPNSVTDIGMFAFYGCSGFTGPLIIPNRITSIETAVFEGCFGFDGPLYIPNSITNIAEQAFRNCFGINGPLIIPNSVNNIETYAFEGCINIESIYAERVNPTTLESSTFENVPKTIPVYVPCGSVAAYRAAQYWSEFTNITDLHYAITVSSEDEAKGMADYSFDCPIATLTATPAVGHVFSRWNDGNTENPRQVELTKDTVFTALFSLATYIVNGDEYEYGDVITLTPEIPDCQHFVSWSDGNTDNPRTLIVTEDADITAVFAKNIYRILWNNYDGALLAADSVDCGEIPTYGGQMPYRETNAQYTYTFSGWNPSIAEVSGDAVYTAQFAAVTNSYTVSFNNYNGTVLQTSAYDYGAMPQYTGTTPVKPATAQYTYTFKGWDKALASVTGSTTYVAQYDSVLNSYAISFKNYDGSLLQETQEDYGTTPTYTGATPEKAATAEFTYTFSGWSPAITTVSGTATYIAQFSSSINVYVVNGDTIAYGTQKTLTATPDDCEHFVRWSDGSTQNPRTITVTGNITLTPVFAVNRYQITWKNSDGNILAQDSIDCGLMPAYSGAAPEKAATPEYSYTFAGWTPNVAVISGNAVYTAVFTSTKNSYTVNGEEHEYGDVITLTAPDSACYTFVGWSNGATANPYQLTLVSDTVVTPIYTINRYAISASAVNGSITGIGTYDCGDEIVLTAVPAEYYHFVSWSDGLTTPSRTVIVSANAAFSATFAKDVFIVNGEEHEYGDVITLTATPDDCEHFVRWSDGSTQNPRTMTVTGNATYTPVFAVNRYQITWKNFDGSILAQDSIDCGLLPAYSGAAPEKTATLEYSYTFAGWTPNVAVAAANAVYTAQFMSTMNHYTVNGEDYPYGATVTLTAPAVDCQHFVRWSDGNTDNPRTITVTGDINVTPEYAVNQYVITTVAENGSIIGGGTYDCDAEITLTATANPGYHFQEWVDDAAADSVRTVTVESDATYTALFEPNCGIWAEWPIIEKYGWLLMLDHQAVKAQGYSFGEQQVSWYRVVGEPDEELTLGDDELVGKGYYLTLGEPLTGTGDYYAVVDVSASQSTLCHGLMCSRIASFAGSSKRQIVLIPTAAQAGEEVRVEGLDPAEETIIMVYSSAGQLIDKLTTNDEVTVSLTVPAAAGCYQVRVHSESVDQTLRYIVNIK